MCTYILEYTIELYVLILMQPGTETKLKAIALFLKKYGATK